MKTYNVKYMVVDSMGVVRESSVISQGIKSYWDGYPRYHAIKEKVDEMVKSSERVYGKMYYDGCDIYVGVSRMEDDFFMKTWKWSMMDGGHLELVDRDFDMGYHFEELKEEK